MTLRPYPAAKGPVTRSECGTDRIALTAGRPGPSILGHADHGLTMPSLESAGRWERSRLASWALAGTLLCCCCQRVPPGATIVDSLQASEGNLAGNPDLGVSPETARRELRAALESTGHFVVRELEPESSSKAARVRLQVESARRLFPVAVQPGGPGDRELAEVAVLLELLLPVKGGEFERLVAEGFARKPAGGEVSQGPDAQSRAAAFEGALGGAMREAATSLVWQMEARKKQDADLLVDLANPDARVRDYAIRALADRRNPAAVPYLIARLDDDSILMVRRAMGALVAIGDRRAVRPLIDLTRRRPPQLVAEIIYALGSLGGPEVEAFLYTLESGAPDEEVRRAATEAFEELRKKREQNASATSSPEPRPGNP
jgi:hypothetical protein